MNKTLLILSAVASSLVSSAVIGQSKPASTVILEPATYTENFEDRELGAWASYPHWQDIAYNQDFRPNEIVPGDPNISVVQKVTAFSNVDTYAGAQKLLDLFLVPEAKLSFRYYLKSNTKSESLKVLFAAGEYGKIEYTIKNPELNRWVTTTVGYSDFVAQNPVLSGQKSVRIYALALLAKFASADPDMPIYFGLDDINFSASREAAFNFATPVMYKLPEYAPYIPKKQYSRGDDFTVKGQWAPGVQKVSLEIASFTDEQNKVFNGSLSKSGNEWSLKSLKLTFPEGLYLAKLTGTGSGNTIVSTQFTIHIAPQGMKGKHPRLLFDNDKKKELDVKLAEPRFKKVSDEILSAAKSHREKIPANELIYDLDQFPKEDWLPTWNAWGNKIYHTGEALRANARAFAFHGDQDAGNYVKEVLLTLSSWPDWTHPWQTNRGRYSEHRTGSWAHRVAEAYDLTYSLMNAEESATIRKAIMKNIVDGAHRQYVVDDDITAATSNWLAMIMGGSLMNMAAIYADGPETENLEPYFTGALLKYYRFINRVVDQKHGAWGEGYGYNNYSFSNMAYSLPSLENVFNIDLTKPLVGSYQEFIWAGYIKKKLWFDYGDSKGDLGAANFWGFLLEKRREPRLSWFYNYMKTGETFEDVLFTTSGIAEDSPFDESPNKVFREIGTTVFKSGWENDDFAFVMRTGSFYNHQHLDQGSFYLADHGVMFLEDRHLKNSTYYDDPIYQPWLIQPVAHSTILIDDNKQSQRTGDHLNFAPGFNDHAYVANFLEGKDAAFSSGDIGKVYLDKVKSLVRNVVFIKPRTLLMLDTAIPAEKDAKVSLLYQTAELNDIKAGQDLSTITKQGYSLNILHLSPSAIETKAVETPHYLYTLQRERHLKKEGMLTVSANTSNGQPLVMANLLTTTKGEATGVTTENGDGFVSGVASGQNFAFSTIPGKTYRTQGIETDAVSVVWGNERVFVALATNFKGRGAQMLRSDVPLSFEISEEGIKYATENACRLVIGAEKKPASVNVNGVLRRDFNYDDLTKSIQLNVPAGEGVIIVR